MLPKRCQKPFWEFKSPLFSMVFGVFDCVDPNPLSSRFPQTLSRET